MNSKRIAVLLWMLLPCCTEAQPSTPEVRYPSVRGLVLTGYQGWFNAEGDGAGLGWKHYAKNGVFEPGSCTIDLWPDVTEYEQTYASPFRFDDGSEAPLFSSYDRSTTFLHFRWMRDYGIDGAFVQRFVASIRSERSKANSNHILMNAVEAAEQYDRAVCVMYDLSGMRAEEVELLMADWEELTSEYGIVSRENNHYLHHNGRPLVAVWGIGFDDGRRYGLDEAERIVDFLRSKGCSVLLGVPAHWRTLSMDAASDSRLHALLEKADIVHPWFVGRFNAQSYDRFRPLIEADIAWCKAHGVDYMPVLYPGFSWYNLRSGVAAPLNQIPRLGGAFFWQQVHGALSLGAESLYLAMFDEMDEGTAFFKCSNRLPVGASPFLGYEGCPSDHYLWLAGKAAEALRGETELSPRMPQRNNP